MGASPGRPTMRCAVTRWRKTALSLAPCLRPQGAPVSPGAAKGSYPWFVQSLIMALKICISSSDWKLSTKSSLALR
jgi:hypothetical protein